MRRIACAVLLAAQASVAAAAPSDVTPGGFLVTVVETTGATPRQLYEALGRVGAWWSPRHSWSGNAANLSLALEAGGCFCERWDRASVEHGRVVHAAPERLLRLAASLGPLQAMGANGTLTFAIAERDGRTALTVTYRVGGAAGLDALAGPVDSVIAEQARRLARYAETGRPD